MSKATTSKPKDAKEEEYVIVEEKVVKYNGEIAVKKYQRGRFLGKGGFARCYEFQNLDTKKISAAKVIAKSSLTKSRAKQKLMSEIKIHRSLHHNNIVGFEHFFEDSENVYITLELCSNQTLNELIRRRKRLHELEAKCYIVQIISALKYLHAHRIIHRDLKLGNLFVSAKMELKIGDFGLATKLEFDGERKRTICGTPNYIAPEILEAKQGHSYEVDVWSLGVILYTMLIGKPPFETSDVKTTYRRIRMNAYTFPEHVHISESAKDMITKILTNDPAKRPTLDELLMHDYLNNEGSIPRLLPASTLACPPSSTYIKQFQCEEPTTTQIRIVNSSKREDGKQGDSDKDKARPDSGKYKGPKVWVKKWVDYSSKYGLGYLLSNASTGVFFNDSTKIVLDPDSHNFIYYERRTSDKKDIGSGHTLTDYPKDLQKKVTLLQHFRSYLEGSTKKGENESKSIGTERMKKEEEDAAAKEQEEPKETPAKKEMSEDTVYVKKWMRTRHAIMFRLSNKVVQVNFQDHTEIILSSESKVVTYVNKKGERLTYPLSTAMESSNMEMAKRLKYTKDILTHMLQSNQTNRAGSAKKDEKEM
jgi:polo-like kinase 1